MAKFIVLYRSPVSFMEGMGNATPEEQQAAMAPWMAWFGRCGEALVDMGGPLGNGATYTAAGREESASDVVGYSVLEAESADAAHALIDGHPHLAWREGCSVELFQLMFPGG